VLKIEAEAKEKIMQQQQKHEKLIEAWGNFNLSFSEAKS